MPRRHASPERYDELPVSRADLEEWAAIARTLWRRVIDPSSAAADRARFEEVNAPGVRRGAHDTTMRGAQLYTVEATMVAKARMCLGRVLKYLPEETEERMSNLAHVAMRAHTVVIVTDTNHGAVREWPECAEPRRYGSRDCKTVVVVPNAAAAGAAENRVQRAMFDIPEITMRMPHLLAHALVLLWQTHTLFTRFASLMNIDYERWLNDVGVELETNTDMSVQDAMDTMYKDRHSEQLFAVYEKTIGALNSYMTVYERKMGELCA